jgi:rhodanese-related sulfurtransferase
LEKNEQNTEPEASMNISSLISLAALLLCGCHPKGTPEAELESMICEVSNKFQEVPQLPTSELAAWLVDADRKPPLLLDVREPEEFMVSHLAGAIQISPDAAPQQVLEQINSTGPIVLYCSVGYRSSALAKRLIDAGVPEVINLEGSIFKWANEGRPMLHAGIDTDKAHPYNHRFGYMLQETLQSYKPERCKRTF